MRKRGPYRMLGKGLDDTRALMDQLAQLQLENLAAKRLLATIVQQAGGSLVLHDPGATHDHLRLVRQDATTGEIRLVLVEPATTTRRAS